MPAALLLVSLLVKLGFLAVRLTEDTHDDARHQSIEQEQEPQAAAEVPQEFPLRVAELEREIVGALTQKGVTAEVTCPADTATVIPGMEFLCTVGDGGGAAAGTAHVVVTAGGGWTWTYTAGCWDLGC